MRIESKINTENRLGIVKRMASAGRMISANERRAMVRKAMAEDDREEVANLELGMIQMRTAYNGLCWNAVVPDHLKMGEQRIYSAYSQTVPALSVSPVTASAPITRASMTRVVAQPSRITSQFEIPYGDMMMSAQDPLAYFEMNAVWDINMAMDFQLLYAFDMATQISASIAGADYSQVAIASDTLDSTSLTSQFGKMAQKRQRPYAVYWNPVDYMQSVPNWSGVITSIKFKDDLIDQIGENDWVSDGWQPDYLGVHNFTSKMVPQGVIYIATAPTALGYMPIYGDIYMQDNPSKTDQAILAMTVNAFMGIDIINAMGVTKITLGSANTTQDYAIKPAAAMAAVKVVEPKESKSEKTVKSK